MNKKLIALIILAIVFFAVVAMLGSSKYCSSFLTAGDNKFLLPIIVISAIIDSVNPCAFSVLFLTIAFLFSIGRLRSDVLKIGASYIIGVLVIYILIGLGITQTFYLFNTPHLMARLGASLLIVLGLINIINDYFPKFPIKLKIPQGSHKKIAQLMEKGSIPTSFILGTFVGFCEFPCTGGPYFMILGLLKDKTTYFQGLSYILLYNLIFIFPLVIILLISSDRTVLAKVEEWKKHHLRGTKFWGGFIMILLGIIIFLL